MKKQLVFFILGIVIILISTPLSHQVMNMLYSNRNLSAEYIPLLNGFIYSFMLIGTLIFIVGAVSFIRNKK